MTFSTETIKTEEEQNTALEEATRKRNKPLLIALLKSGAKPTNEHAAIAVAQNEPEILKLLLDAGATTTGGIRDPLQQAAIANNAPIAELLVDHNNHHTEKIHPEKCFHAFCSTGLVERAKALIPQLPASFDSKPTAHQTARNGHIESLKLLQTLGVDITNTEIITPAYQGNQKDCVLFLLELGETKRKKLTLYFTALCGIGLTQAAQDCLTDAPTLTQTSTLACKTATNNGHLDTLKMLADHGAPIQNFQNELLHLASFNNHLAIAKYLLDRGADPKVNNHQTLSAASFKPNNPIIPLVLKHYSTEELQKIKPEPGRKNVYEIAQKEISKRRCLQTQKTKATEPELEP